MDNNLEVLIDRNVVLDVIRTVLGEERVRYKHQADLRHALYKAVESAAESLDAHTIDLLLGGQGVSDALAEED